MSLPSRVPHIFAISSALPWEAILTFLLLYTHLHDPLQGLPAPRPGVPQLSITVLPREVPPQCLPLLHALACMQSACHAAVHRELSPSSRWRTCAQQEHSSSDAHMQSSCLGSYTVTSRLNRSRLHAGGGVRGEGAGGRGQGEEAEGLRAHRQRAPRHRALLHRQRPHDALHEAQAVCARVLLFVCLFFPVDSAFVSLFLCWVLEMLLTPRSCCQECCLFHGAAKSKRLAPTMPLWKVLACSRLVHCSALLDSCMPPSPASAEPEGKECCPCGERVPCSDAAGCVAQDA